MIIDYKNEYASETVGIIKKSFKTVAVNFGLNPDNASSNPAFINIEKFRSFASKRECFIKVEKNQKIGFVAIEKSKNQELNYFMERLSILPEFRNRGFGKEILNFVFDYVKNKGGKNISIGMINENIKLKEWYMKNGFRVSKIKNFKHLPFTVCFLRKPL